MSRTIHLCDGEILLNPKTGEIVQSITITDGIVTEIDVEPPVDAQIISLGGRIAMPGLVDSHLHLTLGAAGLGDIDLSSITTKHSFQDVMTKRSHTMQADQWMVASGWSIDRLGQQPDVSWLTSVKGTPAICFSEDLHAAVINKALLSQLDEDAIIEMPGGSRIHEGIVSEEALFQGICPLMPHIEIDTRMKRTKHAIKKMHAVGVTMIGTMEDSRTLQEILVPLQETRSMRLRVMVLEPPTTKVFQICQDFAEDPFLKITGFKSFVDGTLGSRTAKMYAPWNDTDGTGVLATCASAGDLQSWATTVAAAGFAPVIHAIGDCAVGLALDALEQIDDALIPRIEHAQFIAEQDLSRIARKWFGVQPLHQPGDAKIAQKAVGTIRARLQHDWKRMLRAGARVSFGSDWPVSKPNPLQAMGVAILRGLTPTEAIIASTTDAAISLRTPESGTLEVGQYGDITVLDGHPLTCDWKRERPSVTMTIIDGIIVFEKEQMNA